MKRSGSTTSGPVAPSSPLRTQRITRTSSSLTQTSRSSFNKEAEKLFRLTRAPVSGSTNQQPGLPEANKNSSYRKGEIVWLILDKPLLLDYADGVTDGFIIRFWPSIIELGKTDETDESSLGIPGIHNSTSLRVRLFTSGTVYDVPQHHALPFWAYSPDGLWLQRLRLQTSKSLFQDPFEGFVRVAKTSSGEETISPLNPEDSLPHFLSDVDASLDIARSWSTTPWTSSHSGGEPATIQPRTSIVCGHRHELWWGAERIVVGDLVRLRIPESQLHHIGADQKWFIPRPLPDSSAEVDLVKDSEIGDGQLFFKLRDLAIVETSNGKELRGFGGLYRLIPVGLGFLPPLDANTEHRHPVLPSPPEGFAFQSVLGGEWEIELSLHALDGRYYPRLQDLLTGPSGVDAYILEVLEGVVCWQTPPLRPRHYKKGSREEIVAQTVRGSRKFAGGSSFGVRTAPLTK